MAKMVEFNRTETRKLMQQEREKQRKLFAASMMMCTFANLCILNWWTKLIEFRERNFETADFYSHSCIVHILIDIELLLLIWFLFPNLLNLFFSLLTGTISHLNHSQRHKYIQLAFVFAIKLLTTKSSSASHRIASHIQFDAVNQVHEKFSGILLPHQQTLALCLAEMSLCLHVVLLKIMLGFEFIYS